ncbi:hypothetical protein C7974DRAFT_388393 [Boeremia exigua]|uniref:uncharacterized protein n=1 Tax=Boeremia exigua TaxID=749465 RepID=UPI001E8E28FE|nr:uncharacterized protein C7974DRAFT_388393 [Boeremia exigua]KAH6639378.1 hypothetical protein C7974DRAFT_388393 [Boeremia exigua]
MDAPSVSPVSALPLGQLPHLVRPVSRKLQKKIFLEYASNLIISLGLSSHRPWRHPTTLSAAITVMLAFGARIVRGCSKHMIWVRLACAALPQEEQRCVYHAPLPSRAPSTAFSVCSVHHFEGDQHARCLSKNFCNASRIGGGSGCLLATSLSSMSAMLTNLASLNPRRSF